MPRGRGGYGTPARGRGGYPTGWHIPAHGAHPSPSNRDKFNQSPHRSSPARQSFADTPKRTTPYRTPHSVPRPPATIGLHSSSVNFAPVANSLCLAVELKLDQCNLGDGDMVAIAQWMQYWLPMRCSVPPAEALAALSASPSTAPAELVFTSPSPPERRYAAIFLHMEQNLIGDAGMEALVRTLLVLRTTCAAVVKLWSAGGPLPFSVSGRDPSLSYLSPPLLLSSPSLSSPRRACPDNC